ncbi:MAG: TIGR01777 family oxidoreductase [Methanothrix sp.]|nr:TIGR01777 family oxidoreductase [Methanothrix sp.]
MKIVLFGGSGFLGSYLVKRLAESNHEITLVSRRPDLVQKKMNSAVTVKPWTPVETLPAILDGSDAVVNLAGESIGSGRWTVGRKQMMLSSRVDTTRTVLEAIGKTTKKPSVLLNASAVGYYGNVPEGDVTETHAPGNDFLADLCVRWEAEATKAKEFGVRVVLPRTGIVLANDGGALQRMLLPFRLFAGGPLGSGRQWFPWIHIDDEVNAMVFALENSGIVGPVNFTAPEAVTMKQFCSALGKAMHRPSWAPVPAFILRTILGEMADALVLGGQKAVPTKLIGCGFEFKYGRLEKALASIV